MARPLRIQYPGAWYHLTCRGNEGRSIFTADADRCRFLAILAQSAAIYQVEIHAYVLMSDHFHLVVHTPQANLNRFMQRFNTTYSVYFNRRHGCRGQLYQGATRPCWWMRTAICWNSAATCTSTRCG